MRCCKTVKASFHYERGKEHSLFLLLIFPLLKSKRAQSEAKKSIKQTMNTPFHACSGNEPSLKKRATKSINFQKLSLTSKVPTEMIEEAAAAFLPYRFSKQL